MVRMSDILKRVNDELPEEPRLRDPEPIEEKAKEQRKENLSPPLVEISKAVIDKQIAKLDDTKAQALYDQALDIVKRVFANATEHKEIKIEEVDEIVDKFVNRVALGAEEMIVFVSQSTLNDYPYRHCVNVCILSIEVALDLGYNKSKLSELGIAALLHDIGMTKVMDIANQPRKLRPDEYDEIKKHPLHGTEILEKTKDLSPEIINIVRQQHERINGEGYPNGLKDTEINEYAQIIAVTDVYEAITHKRSHRDRMLPYEAMKEMLSLKDIFNIKLLKILLNRISVYPVGSWVKLNTGEIGRVIKVNSNAPLRPMVNVVLDREGKKLENRRPVNLSQNVTVYIKKPIDENKIKDKIGEIV